MKIAISELKTKGGELVRQMQAGNVVELTHYGNVIARVVPIAKAEVADATAGLLAAKFAPVSSASQKQKPGDRLHRDPERENYVRSYHAHTGDPLADLAEMETRHRLRFAGHSHVVWPPRRKTQKNEVSWVWEEWVRLRQLAGLPVADNMPAEVPLAEEIEAQTEETVAAVPVAPIPTYKLPGSQR